MSWSLRKYILRTFLLMFSHYRICSHRSMNQVWQYLIIVLLLYFPLEFKQHQNTSLVAHPLSGHVDFASAIKKITQFVQHKWKHRTIYCPFIQTRPKCTKGCERTDSWGWLNFVSGTLVDWWICCSHSSGL